MVRTFFVHLKMDEIIHIRISNRVMDLSVFIHTSLLHLYVVVLKVKRNSENNGATMKFSYTHNTAHQDFRSSRSERD